MNQQHKTNWRELFQPAFVICVVILAAAAGGLTVTGRTRLQKDPLPLQRALSEMDEQALLPYRVIDKVEIVHADVLRALGTEEYIQWFLEDTSVPENDPCRFSSLFVTYYTGTPDAVPHIPDECYLGGGSSLRDSFDTVIPVRWTGADGVEVTAEIPVRGAVFSNRSPNAWEPESVFQVLYTFRVNGTYRGNRDATRFVLGTNRSRYSYYAKVEWRFFGTGGIGGGHRYPSREQTIEASEKLLSVVLGELERSHWPDWEEALRRSDGSQTE